MKESTLPNIPFDPQAEAQIIGACIGDSNGLGIVAETLRPDDFFDREHQKIFRAILEISAGNSEVTEWAVREFLERDTEFTSASGFSKLAQCSLNSIGANSLNGACRRVKALSTKRFALYLGNSLAEKASTPAVSTRELLEEFGPKFDALRDGGADLGGRLQHISEIAKDLRPLLERVSERRGLMMGVSTGFGSLDGLVPGFIGGELSIWAVGRATESQPWRWNLPCDSATTEIPSCCIASKWARRPFSCALPVGMGASTTSALPPEPSVKMLCMPSSAPWRMLRTCPYGSIHAQWFELKNSAGGSVPWPSEKIFDSQSSITCNFSGHRARTGPHRSLRSRLN